MRFIKVENCQGCPYIVHNSGEGHGGSFVTCKRFGFMLKDEDGPQNFDISSGVYKECRLPEKIITVATDACDCNLDNDDVNKWNFCPMCGGKI